MKDPADGVGTGKDLNASQPKVSSELDLVLNHLQARVEAGQDPSRYDARWLLLELGEVLRRERPEDVEARIARARKTVQRLGDGWKRAVLEEMQLAAAEHIQGVDPRWLSHPRYDLEYTLTARKRLEARILAAEALGSPLEENLAKGVANADRMLEEYAAGRSKSED